LSYPHLYECSKCGKAVKVTAQGEGAEPLKTFSCGHDDAIIWANRKVELRGIGKLGAVEGATLKVKMTVRQFLSAMTGRSI
jgi:hypothetical protein